jgi:hypothetical protein
MEIRSLPLFGDTQFLIDEEGMKITNTTMPDHLLYPGYVERQVLTIGTGVYIQTVGVGTGSLGDMNIAGSGFLWRGVDAAVARSLGGIWPPSVIPL